MSFLKPTRWRSEKHRRLVASLDCIICGTSGRTQAAHRNEGKSMGMKACDSQMMALCVECHRWIDQGGKTDKATRRVMELSYVKATRKKMVDTGIWSAAAEAAYMKVTGEKT